MIVIKLPFMDRFNGKINELTNEGLLLPKLDSVNKKNSISLANKSIKKY